MSVKEKSRSKIVNDCSVTYTAPEVWETGLFSTESDMWALGCTIYELMTKRPLFAHVPEEIIKQRLLKDDFEVPFCTRYSKDLNFLVRNLLDKTKTKRFTASYTLISAVA